MKIYEVVNYYTDDLEGIEARDVLGRYLEFQRAWNKLFAFAVEREVELGQEDLAFEIASPRLLVSDYYVIEEHETDD